MSSKKYPGYIGLRKYGKPLLLIFIAYFILTIIVCFRTNFNNDSLEKKTGTIEEIKINIVPGKAMMWYILNIKMEGDPIYYVQEWRVQNNIFIYYFLFNEKKFTKNSYFKQGRKVEFYVDNNPESYSYILTEKRHDTSMVNSYISAKTPNDITTVLSYGLKIDDEVILNYTKRDFVTSLWGKMSLGLIFLLFPLTFIGITYLDDIFAFFTKSIK